jgi:hypothetical protein
MNYLLHYKADIRPVILPPATHFAFSDTEESFLA